MRDRGTRAECPGCVRATTRHHHHHVMAVLSGTRTVRDICVSVATPCSRAAGVSAEDATKYARRRLTVLDNV